MIHIEKLLFKETHLITNEETSLISFLNPSFHARRKKKDADVDDCERQNEKEQACVNWCPFQCL